jgi:hypothetical protein
MTWSTTAFDPKRRSPWILPDPWKTLCVSHRSLDGANTAPPTGPTGFYCYWSFPTTEGVIVAVSDVRAWESSSSADMRWVLLAARGGMFG